MPKVYYGKDSITPNFLPSSKNSETELFRSQITKESLQNAEQASLDTLTDSDRKPSADTLENQPLYTGNLNRHNIKSTKNLSLSKLSTAKKIKKYSPVALAFGAFLAVILFLFFSVSNLGNQIEILITRATDTMFGSYSENTLRITEELLAKKQGAFPKYFENRLKTNGIEVVDAGSSYHLVYDGATITSENFRNFYAKNIAFQEAFTRAKRARASNFFDKPATMSLAKIGITRNLFSAYKNTGNHETDTKNYQTTEEGVFGDKTNSSINTTTETEDTDERGNKTTKISKTGEDIDSSNIEGDTPNVKANNYLLSTAGRVAEAGGLTCTALKVANLISVAIAANEIYQAMHFFMSNQENISKTKAGYGNEAAANSVLNFLNTPATTEYTDVSTGEKKTITGAPIQAEGFGNVLAGEKVNLNYTKNFSINSAFLATGFALGLTTARARACGGIRAVGAAISLATLAFGGGLIKTAVTLLKTTVVNVALASTIAGMLSILLPYIQKVLFENPAKTLVGKPAGEKYVQGAALINKKVGRSTSGQSLASKEAAVAYHKETLIAANREAELDRKSKSAFDASSPNTFLGSILGRFSRITSSATLFSSLSNLSEVSKNSFSSILGHAGQSVLAADGSEGFTTDTELAGTDYQKIFGNDEDCEALTSIGAACDMYGGEVIVTDVTTEKLSSTDPEYQRVVNQNIRKNAEGFDEVIPNSLLAHKTMFCDERDSPFGHFDANIANAMNTNLGFANSIPIISEAVELYNAVSDMSPETQGWASGAYCVMGSQNPHWQELKYLQHYTEQTRICTQIKCASVVDSEGNDRNPITAYKEEYYAKNPIDTSRSGILARISGITKNQAETVIAFFDYANYLANYQPPKAEKPEFTLNSLTKETLTTKDSLGSVAKISSILTKNSGSNHHFIHQNLTQSSYADLKTISRNRSYLV